MISSLRNRVVTFRQTLAESLLLDRARVVSQFSLARNERYREQLQRTLVYLDAHLRALDAVSTRKRLQSGL